MKYFENLALSNSKISSFSHDPSYYYKLYVTKEITQKESLSLSLGTLVHCLILEPETFENKYLISSVEKPTGLMLPFIETLAKFEIMDDLSLEAAYLISGYKISKDKVISNFKESEYLKAYYEELMMSKDKIIISQSDYDKANNLCSVALNNPQWDKILSNLTYKKFDELEIYWNYRGVNCKAKLDRLYVAEASGVLFIKYFDFKTDSQNPVHLYEKSFLYWKTYRQMSFYVEAIKAWAEQIYPSKEIILSMYAVPIDTVRNKSLIYCVDMAYLNKGIKEINEDMDKLAWHVAEDKWEYPKTIYDALELAGGLSLICQDNERVNTTSSPV